MHLWATVHQAVDTSCGSLSSSLEASVNRVNCVLIRSTRSFTSVSKVSALCIHALVQLRIGSSQVAILKGNLEKVHKILAVDSSGVG